MKKTKALHWKKDKKSLTSSRISLASLYFLFGTLIAFFAGSIPDIKANLGLSLSDIGISLLVGSGGAMLSMYLLPFILKTTSSRNVTLIVVFLSIVIFLFLPFVSSDNHFSFFNFWLGLFFGSANVGMNTYAVFLEKCYTKPVMSSLHALFSLGGMIGSCELILLNYFHWSLLSKVIFCSVQNIIILAIVPFFLLTEKKLPVAPSEEQEETITNKGRKKTKFTLPFLLMCSIALFVLIIEGGMADWSALYLKYSSELGAQFSAAGYACFSGTMALGRFLGDQWVKKWGLSLVARAGSVFCFFGIINAICFNTHFYILLISFLMMGLGCSNIYPILCTSIGKIMPKTPQIGIAVVSAFGYSGTLIGPAIIGFVSDYFSSLRVGFGIILISSLFIMLFTRYIPHSKKP